MTPKQTAIKNVSIFVATALILGVASAFVVAYINMATVVTILMVAFFAYIVKVLYDMELSKAESAAKLEKYND